MKIVELVRQLDTFEIALHAFGLQFRRLLPSVEAVSAGIGGKVDMTWTFDDLVSLNNQVLSLELGLGKIIEAAMEKDSQ